MNNSTFVGNLTADPKRHQSDSGNVRTTFGVAVNEGTEDKKKTHYIDCTAFDSLGDNLFESLSKGMRVIVLGRFNTYQSEVTIKGEDKSINRLSITVSAAGPELRWATAKVSKVERDDNGGNRGNGGSDGGSRSGGSSGSGSSTPSPSDDSDF